MFDLKKLEALAPKMPERTPQEIRRQRERHAGHISPITVCECGWADFFHRMGCKHGPIALDQTGHQCQWLWLVADGPLEGNGTRRLKHGVDFCFIGENDAIQPDSGLSDPESSEVGQQ